jgi:hypothetical protein
MARQPCLFEMDATAAQVNAQRDEALQRVAQHADEHYPQFAEEAATFIARYLQAHGPQPGEMLSRACRLAGIVPHDDRAFGPVYLSLCRRGLIEKVGTVRRERGHGTSGGNVWALRKTG